MEPIINPKWFYLIEMSEKLSICLFTFGILCIVAIGICIICRFFEEKTPIVPKKATTVCIITVMLFIASVALPSKDTGYKMLIASMVTPNNIEAIGGSAEGVVDYIVESINKINNEEEERVE